MPRRVLVIFNPHAGRRGRAAVRLRRVVAEIERLGCSAVVRTTGATGDAERLAGDAEPGFDLIVAAGGDGTVNEVANGVWRAGRPFAVLPLGTANVLANEIGLPRRPAELAAVIADAVPQPIWPGRIGDRLFVAIAGIGFDAEVIGRLDQDLKRRIGKLAFVRPILACLWRRRPSFEVCADGAVWPAASAIIAKGRFYAGRFVIAPDARLADPLLSTVLFRDAGRLAALRYLGAMVLGVLHRLPDVTIVTARRIAITADDIGSAEAPPVETDGEISGRLPIVARIAERPLLLVAPAAPRRPGSREPGRATARFMR